MNDEEKKLLQVQVSMERWAELKYRISNGLCIVCGGDSNVRLYVHFCDNCLLEAGVSVEFLDSPEEVKPIQPVTVVTTKPVVAVQVDKDLEWMKFIKHIKNKPRKRKERKA